MKKNNLKILLTLFFSILWSEAKCMQSDSPHLRSEPGILPEKTANVMSKLENYVLQPIGSTGIETLLSSPQESSERPMEREEFLERSKSNTLKFKQERKRKWWSPDDSTLDIDYYTKLHSEEEGVTYFTGLSIDGGGFRGVIPALLLQKLNQCTNRMPYELFDVIGGTSIGGILALGLATPNWNKTNKPLATIDPLIELFTQKGREIFPQRYKYNPLRVIDKISETRCVKYDHKPLENLLKAKLGDTGLHNMKTRVVIPAVKTSGSYPETYVFNSNTAKYVWAQKNINIPLWEVGRSTSAAPVYFPGHTLSYQSDTHLIDGGVWLNNPSALVAQDIYKYSRQESMFVSPGNILLLSLGTGYSSVQEQIGYNVGWTNVAKPLINTMFETASAGVHKSLEDLWDAGLYRRVNPELDKHIELDDIDSLAFLTAKAQTKFEEIETLVAEGMLRKVLESDYISHKNL